jgi:hypothetical protein
VTLMSAPEMSAPVSSFANPLMRPESLCAVAIEGANNTAKAKHKVCSLKCRRGIQISFVNLAKKKAC